MSTPETMSAEPAVTTSAPSSPRRPRRLWMGMVGGGVLLAVLVGLALGPGEGWRRWERRRAFRLTEQSRKLLDGGDLRGGGLAAARALQLDPTSADSCRLLAEVSARLGRANEALDWARQAVAIRPDIPGGQLQVASLALQFDRLPVAVTALDEVSGWARELPGYHALRGALAVRQSRVQDAAAEFAAARRGDPDNEGYLFSERSLLLSAHAGDIEARIALSRLAADARDRALRVSARKALLADDVLTHNAADLRLRGRDLEADPAGDLDEWFPYLEFLLRENDPRMETALNRLQGNLAASRDTAMTTALLGWMTAHGLAPAAARWGRTLPGPLRADVRGVRPAVAFALAAARDWAGLREFCGAPGENWGAREFLRLGYLTLATGNLGDGRASDDDWILARSLADRTPGAPRLLAEVFANRGPAWTDRLETLLWGIADGIPGPDTRWALDTLNRRGLAAGDSRALLRVADRALAIDPQDAAAHNNHASLKLLRNEEIEAAALEARHLYESNRGNPAAASTYAFALLRQGHATEAVEVMHGLSPESARDPATALVYGLCLEGNGNHEAAVPYLTLAREAAAALLPEERALLNAPPNAVSPVGS